MSTGQEKPFQDTEHGTRRVAVFFHYDAFGEVSKFVNIYLASLRQCVECIVFVNNGSISCAGQRAIEREVDIFILRKNVGFDSWAYKEAIDLLGWDRIAEFDELILCNFTCYAPKDELQKIFLRMENVDCDFWGIAMHPEYPHYFLPKTREGYINEHIMSYFMVFRKSVIKSEAFQAYWRDLPEIRTYAEAVGYHEVAFTKFLRNQGFKAASLIPLSETRSVSLNSSVYQADDLLVEHDCKLIKRKALFLNYSNFLSESSVRQASTIMDEISTDAELHDAIWDDLLRTQAIYRTMDLLHLNFGLDASVAQSCGSGDLQLLYCFFIDSPNTAHLLLKMIRSKKFRGTVVTVFSTGSLANAYQGIFHEFLSQQEGARIIFPQEYFDNWFNALHLVLPMAVHGTLLCFLSLDWARCEDGLLLPYISAHRDTLESLVTGKTCDQDVINAFQINSRLGILLPFSPVHGTYLTEGIWADDEAVEMIQSVCDRLAVPSPLSVPETSGRFVRPARAFWIRGGDCSDIDLGLLPITSSTQSTSSIFEALIPTLAQHKGFYTGRIASAAVYSAHIDNLRILCNDLRMKLTKSELQINSPSQSWTGYTQGKEFRRSTQPFIVKYLRKRVHSLRDRLRKVRAK